MQGWSGSGEYKNIFLEIIETFSKYPAESTSSSERSYTNWNSWVQIASVIWHFAILTEEEAPLFL